jgi:hypothetical protein
VTPSATSTPYSPCFTSAANTKAGAGARKGKTGHYWLKDSELEVLRKALDGSRDEAYMDSYRSIVAKHQPPSK